MANPEKVATLGTKGTKYSYEYITILYDIMYIMYNKKKTIKQETSQCRKGKR